MRRWLLVAFVLLVAAAAALMYAYHFVLSSPSLSPASVVAPDAVALNVVSDSADASPATLLGMGTGTSDILNSSMASTLRGARIGVLRFGDIGADDYDWRGGCIYGDVGTRPECYGIAGQGGKLDQFLTFAGQVGAQPLIVVNGEVDDPQQAAGLVTYYWQHCAHAVGKPCPDPYWEIGDSPASWKHFAVPLARRQPSDAQVIQPDQYAALVISYAAAMTQATPTYVTSATRGYKLKIVADEWITGATDQSWVDSVIAVDTHYAPLLYAPPGPPPSTQDVIGALHGYGGRPGLDAWLQDLRDSLTQFSQSGSISIILGRWSIDTNISAMEPDVYGGYAQALFTAQMIAHVWQDAQGGGRNPMLLAVQSPITGQAQEPFDITSLQPRPAVAVYTLVGRYFGTRALHVREGAALTRPGGVVAAAALAGPDDARVLLINTNRDHARTIELQGMTARACDMWWIAPDGAAPTGMSAIQHLRVAGTRITVPPWAIAVVRAA